MSGDQIKKYEMGGECGRGEVHTGFLWGNVRGTNHLEDLGIG
jgi:hypothetical protein